MHRLKCDIERLKTVGRWVGVLLPPCLLACPVLAMHSGSGLINGEGGGGGGRQSSLPIFHPHITSHPERGESL